MDVLPIKIVQNMGLDPCSLIPVKAQVVCASQGSKLNIVGGLFLQVRNPGPHSQTSPSALRLFYVASNVSRTYLSLSTLQALHVISADFPTIPYSPTTVGAVSPASLPPCTNNGVILPGEKPCHCPKRSLGPTEPSKLPCAPTEENLPKLKQYILD